MSSELNVLLVEDEAFKREAVVAALQTRVLNGNLRVEVAASYEEARERLRDACFDLLILDLHIPGAHQPPDPRFSIALLQDLVKGVLNSPTHVIGLTQHEASALAHQAEFQRYLFHMEIFSDVDFSWADRLSERIKYLFDSARTFSRYSLSRPATDFVVFTARHENEFKPILEDVEWDAPPERSHVMFPGVPMVHGTIRMNDGEHRTLVISCMEQMGIAASAAFATQLICLFRPRLLAMLGMCCGFQMDGRSARLDDVVFVDEASCWDEGKYSQSSVDGVAQFLNRSKTLALPQDVRRMVESFVERHGEKLGADLSGHAAHRQLLRDRTLREHCNKVVRVSVGRMLSGLNVISDKSLISKIASRSPSAVALDMEAFGLFKAASLPQLFNPSYLCVKGVADFGVDKEQGRFDKAQRSASRCSYVAFRQFIEFLHQGGWGVDSRLT